MFRVTPDGVLTKLVRFLFNPGARPRAELILGRDGNFYGTTETSASDVGTVFKISTNGVLTTLVVFNYASGVLPHAGLVLGNDGSLYGTTSVGGSGGGGTIFRLVLSPKFTSVASQPGGSVLLTGTGPINGGYRLRASADLSLPFASWTLLTSASLNSNGNFSYADAGVPTNSSRFYQLSVP